MIGLRSTAWVTVAIAGVLSLAGCGGDDDSSGEIVRTGPTPVETKPDGRLTADPSPLTLEEVARLPDNSPQRVVMRLLFSVQWGDLPATADAYDPRIVRGLVRARIVDAYGWLSNSFSATRPVVRERRRAGDKGFVGVELLTKLYAPARESFSLLRRNGAWRIVWDTLLARSLAGQVLSARATDPSKPSLGARRAAEAATARYRRLASSIASGVVVP